LGSVAITVPPVAPSPASPAHACARLLIERQLGSSGFALVLTGGVLMAHDWKDHDLWFERGRGSQP
jgi:hypothetical protein